MMGTRRIHPPVKIIAACTRLSGFVMEPIHRILEEKLSIIEQISDTFDFSQFTSYYTEEMGAPLIKDFIVFTGLENPERLPALKLWTNEIEERFMREKHRQINLDPGYICDARLVLATTKNYTHRLYLNDGIFGDVHLIYQNHTFHAQPWTYPDYKQTEIIKFLNSVRENYMQQLGKLPRQNFVRGNE